MVERKSYKLGCSAKFRHLEQDRLSVINFVLKRTVFSLYTKAFRLIKRGGGGEIGGVHRICDGDNLM
jgi:hypothetical protein